MKNKEAKLEAVKALLDMAKESDHEDLKRRKKKHMDKSSKPDVEDEEEDC